MGRGVHDKAGRMLYTIKSMIQPIPVITLSQDLEAICDQLSSQPFIAVDTEFMRQTTYRPKLCLIQMAGTGIQALVDPLAPGLDLRPFYQLMANRDVVKVFHAARQDVEIVYQEAGIIPEPLFDTQVAAMALGFGEAVSYSMLAKKLLKRNLDKTYQAIDWTIRPMSRKQLEYALGDVTHLLEIYVKLNKRLKETGRGSWLEEEVAQLTDRRTYEFDPAEAWKRMKLGGKTAKARAIIKALAAWREQTAQIENVPRGRVLKDDTLYEIAKYAPDSIDALARLRTAREVARTRGTEIVAITAAAMANTAGDDTEEPARDAPAAPSAVIELLRVLLKAVSGELNIAPKLIAGTEDLEKLALSDDADICALKGWRRQVFGEKALALKSGDAALMVRNGRIRLLDLSARAADS